VYARLLDASQAFDRVEYTGLFKILLRKGICPIMARIVSYLHLHQKIRIRRSDTISFSFFNIHG
jgi:hypothetical protein